MRLTASFAVCLAAIVSVGAGRAADDSAASVVVLHEPGMPVRGAASSAPVVARILEAAGLKTRLISARELADPAVLDPGRVELLVLPTGQSFPVAARDNVVRFLRAGGDLIHLGGYAFENLLWEHQGRWCTQEELQKADPAEAKTRDSLFRPMGSARGKPMNELKLEPEQLGMFDASFPLKRACRLAAAQGQRIVRPSVELRCELQGWAASGIEGDYANNGHDFLKAKIATNARWLPLLETYDRYGRPRGAAAAMLLNLAGFYAGSNWAYFGVENVDLFADPSGPGAQALQDAARFLVRGVYLAELNLAKRLLREGEPIEAQAVVRNTGVRPQSVWVAFSVGTAGKRDLPRIAQRALSVRPGEVQTVRVELSRPADEASLSQVLATLLAGDEPIDEVAAGYVVDRPDVIRSAPDLRFADNYFTRNGRPMFLFGSDETAYVYLTPHENPLTWARDLLAARDIGMNLYENLQYSRPGHEMRDEDWRNFRAMAQLTQQYNMIYMPGMLIVHNVAVGDDEIAEQSRQCEGYAAILWDVPGCLYYINGDYRCIVSPKSAELKGLWNAWLCDRYATAQRLREAWGPEAVAAELGALAIPAKTSPHWDAPVAMDLVRFSQWLTSRWNRAHLAAVRRIDALHPITSEYYQVPVSGIHLRTTLEGHDVANTNLFRRVEVIPQTLRWNDLRTRGRGLSVGEYGMQAHPAWAKEGGPQRGYAMSRTEQRQSRLFTAVAHYALGMGATKIQNWCLRDAQHRSVHPWGIFYAQPMIPKDVAYVHRNLSLLWRHFSPRYVAPPLAVCIPLALGQGNQRTLECDVAYRAFASLFELHHDFNVFDDGHLENLAATTKALVYPSPFAVADAAYQRLLAWVRNGGTLLVTGDFSFDENRRRTRAGRLKELAGVELVAENYPNVARESGQTLSATFTLSGLGPMALKPCLHLKSAGAEVLGTGPQGEPLLVRNRVGRGIVYYTPDPLELAADPDAAEARRRLYSAVLRSVPLAPLAVEPNEPWLQVFAQPTARGTVHVVFNARQGESSAVATLPTAAGPVSLNVCDGWPAMAAVTPDGRLVAAFAHAKVEVGQSIVMGGAGLKGILALDGRDVRQSDALLVAPWEPGAVTLPARTGPTVAVVGEFREGRWTGLEHLPVDSRAPRVNIDADQAVSLVLVCPRDETERWQRQLTDAMLHPEKIQGY